MKIFQNETSRSIELIDALAGASVYVIGDLMLDVYVEGKVSRISPEAPIPIVASSFTKSYLGGAANVAANIGEFTEDVRVAGWLADDLAGVEVSRLLQERQVSLCKVETKDPNLVTTKKTRIISKGHQIVRIDDEQTISLSDLENKVILEDLAEFCSTRKNAVLVISDYGKGVISKFLIKNLEEFCSIHDIKIIVDPKPENINFYSRGFLIKPNLAEAKTIAISHPSSNSDLVKLSSLVRQICGAENIALSMSQDGVYFQSTTEEGIVIPSSVLELVDVSGAGDSMVAGIALALSVGATPLEAVRLGNEFAGIACTHAGTYVVRKDDLMTLIDVESSENVIDPKILDWTKLDVLVRSQKRLGKRIVFTNGVFDIFHAGHLKLLKEARALGDVLVVALNADESTRALKGVGRPINNIHDRLEVLSSLSCVTAVTSFDQQTPLELILRLQPDIVVKGGDYKEEDVVGWGEVDSWGGEVKIIALAPGLSTSSLSRGIGRPKAF